MSTDKPIGDLGSTPRNAKSLQTLRHTHDELASAALEELLQITGAESSACEHAQGNQDLYATLREHHPSDPMLSAFWNQTISVPEWVDWQQIERGQKIFYKHSVANIVGFALQGFVGQNAAAFGPAEVLIRTGGLSTRNLLRRVMETFQVRLLHASVRRRILSLVETHPGYFDTAKYGVPVNTYDSILVVTFLRCNPVWIQLPQFGIRLTAEETEDFVALYRYLSYLLGTPNAYFASAATAKATMDAMLAGKRCPTEASRIIANSFIDCLVDRAPVYISRGFLEAGSRSMNGDVLCDELGLGRPNLVNYACFTSFCWLIRLVSILQRISPVVVTYLTNYFQQQLPRVIAAALGESTKFDFQYMPTLGRKKGDEAVTVPSRISILDRKLEGLLLLLFASVFVGILCFFASQVVIWRFLLM